MARHALAFLDGLGLPTCDVLGFSLGGMIAQQMAQDRPSIIRRMILVATAPRRAEDIMHLEKASLATYFGDPNRQGYAGARHGRAVHKFERHSPARARREWHS
jgi:pimeloyl-ACP methyl ester carboxylesterase